MGEEGREGAREEDSEAVPVEGKDGAWVVVGEGSRRRGGEKGAEERGVAEREVVEFIARSVPLCHRVRVRSSGRVESAKWGFDLSFSSSPRPSSPSFPPFLFSSSLCSSHPQWLRTSDLSLVSDPTATSLPPPVRSPSHSADPTKLTFALFLAM